MKAILSRQIREGDVLIIRNEGPRGGPGMPEMLSATSALMGVGYKNVVLITDGRFSGGTRGPCIGHVSRRLRSGGLLLLCRKETRSLSISLPEQLTCWSIQKLSSSGKIHGGRWPDR